jgi:hypothetical protein
MPSPGTSVMVCVMRRVDSSHYNDRLDDRWYAERVERVEDDVLRALARRTPPTPSALRFLLRRFGVSARPDLDDRLGRALAVSLGLAAAATATIDRAAWLLLLGEARRLSQDDRMPAAVATLVDGLAAEWGADLQVEVAALSIEACLASADDDRRAAIVPRAIDELERIASHAYVPGRPARDVGQVVRLASSLLTAFTETARLPYAMLAEELVQSLMRSSRDRENGLFVASFELNCAAAIVLIRLGALHRNANYRAGAIVAVDADYDRDADRVLASLALQSPADLRIGAYGLALVERLNRS